MRRQFFRVVKYLAFSFLILAFLAEFSYVRAAEYGEEQEEQHETYETQESQESQGMQENLGQQVVKIKQWFPLENDKVQTDSEGNITIVLSSLNFESGKSNILPEQSQLLDNVYKAAQMFPDRKIRITGHTDSVGSSEYNKMLSKKRAENVANYMKENHGVDPDNMEVIGAGEESPMASEDTMEGRSLNRRIEITFVAQ